MGDDIGRKARWQFLWFGNLHQNTYRGDFFESIVEDVEYFFWESLDPDHRSKREINEAVSAFVQELLDRLWI